MGKKVVKLTESDLKGIIERVIREQSKIGSFDRTAINNYLSKTTPNNYVPGSILKDKIKNSEDIFKFINILEGFDINDMKTIGLSVNPSSRGVYSPHLGEPGNEDMSFKVWSMITDDMISAANTPLEIICKNGLNRFLESRAKQNKEMNNLYANYPAVFVNVFNKQLSNVGIDQNTLCDS